VSAGAEVWQHLWTDHRVCDRLLAAIEQMASDIEVGDERALRVARGIMARERGYRLVAAAFAAQANPLAPPASASIADVARWLAEHGEDPFER
jgi:hypothetical protein